MLRPTPPHSHRAASSATPRPHERSGSWYTSTRMEVWTTERVLSLAPDAASASAGQGLATPKKWTLIARSDRALWGLCQGSGKDPYQARIDLSEPAFKCGCPSRKFPCKHGLGLLLLFAKSPEAFTTQTEPGWVEEWLASRSQRAEKKVERAKEAAEKAPDPLARAKRLAQRDARVEEGVATCRVWLHDLIRSGLGHAQTIDHAEFDRFAARMVDAQAPGLATFIRAIPSQLSSGSGWEARTLDHLGRIHLLLEAASRLAVLPEDLASDVRTTLGYSQSREDALAGPSTKDTWLVVAQVMEDDDRVRVRRTWLLGASTGTRALILDFAVGVQPFDPSLIGGTEFEGELAFYPGRLRQRALVKSRGDLREISPDRFLSPAPGASPLALDESIPAMLEGYARALAANPWTPQWPCFIRNSRLAPVGDDWHLIDHLGHSLPISPHAPAGGAFWQIVAAGAGHPGVTLAEWDGRWLIPSGLAADDSARPSRGRQTA